MPAAAWSSCNEGIAAVPADSLVEGDHSIAVAVVAANRATAAKAKIIRRFMGSLPVECAPTSTLRASCPKSAVLGLYGGFSCADLRLPPGRNPPPFGASAIDSTGACASDRPLGELCG